MTDSKVPRVVVVGGGFGGLEAARHIAKLPVRVLLLDRKNHHTFQPLLYQVATAGLSPAEIAAPLRSIMNGYRNVETLLCEVTGFDLQRKLVRTLDAEIPYDYLVVSAGVRHSYFGRNDWEPYAPGLKTIEDALEIRRRLLTVFENAERSAALTGTHQDVNIVVVGGGPTGVELAGTISEVARKALARDFRRIDPAKTRILLIEAGPSVLPTYTPELSASARQQLERLGVEVRTGTRVTDVRPHEIQMGSEVIPAAITIWAAGVEASPLGRALATPADRAGRVAVHPDCSLPGHPEVFVIGDLALLKDNDGHPLPGTAPVAMQMGRFVAKAISADLRHIARGKFTYVNRGSLATIGRAAAVAEFPDFKLKGYPAWLAWLFIHILFLIGFRNRILVMVQWAWSYFTYERSARLITDEVGKGREQRPAPETLRNEQEQASMEPPRQAA